MCSRVCVRGDLPLEVTIRSGDQVGRDGDDAIHSPVRSRLALEEVQKVSCDSHVALVYAGFLQHRACLCFFLLPGMCSRAQSGAFSL